VLVQLCTCCFLKAGKFVFSLALSVSLSLSLPLALVSSRYLETYSGSPMIQTTILRSCTNRKTENAWRSLTGRGSMQASGAQRYSPGRISKSRSTYPMCSILVTLRNIYWPQIYCFQNTGIAYKQGFYSMWSAVERATFAILSHAQ